MDIISKIKGLSISIFPKMARPTIYSADINDIAAAILRPQNGIKPRTPAHEQSVVDLITEKLKDPSFDINGLTLTGTGDSTILELALLVSPRVTDFVLSIPGANPNATEKHGIRPLMRAITYPDKVELTASLLKHPDTDVNLLDNAGRSAAHWLLWYSIDDPNEDEPTITILQSLIDRGASIKNIEEISKLFASRNASYTPRVAEFVNSLSQGTDRQPAPQRSAVPS